MLLLRGLSCSCANCRAGRHWHCSERRRPDGSGHVGMPRLHQMHLESSKAQAAKLRAAISQLQDGEVFARRCPTAAGGYQLLEACRAPAVVADDSEQHAAGTLVPC